MQREKKHVPWLVPATQPIELFFFQRVFTSLCYRRKTASGVIKDLTKKAGKYDEKVVPLVEFQRAMVRLFRVLKDTREFDPRDYDFDQVGAVGWYDFCSVWRDRQISVKLSIAERVFLTLEDSERSKAGRIMSLLVFMFIFVSVTNFILSTLPEMQQECPVVSLTCRPRPLVFFDEIDLYCVIFFTWEYGTRLLLSAFMRSELVDRDKSKLLEWMISEEAIEIPTPWQRIVSFGLDWSNIIDLAAVLPWYLSQIIEDTHGDSVVLRLIRLTRVIRAFRLGRRFEAVIVIMRSLKRSLRALYVLVLNLTLGMVLFGALMYSFEQGEWNRETLAFERAESFEFNSTTREWDEVRSKSPFESIPACFWWAVVTATTVGYGDAHTPTTASGKICAAIAMAWSLCVLALPIGVIGGNFSQVWREFDTEKKLLADIRLQEEWMMKKSVALSDPLSYCRRILIEVWHDAGISDTVGQGYAEFMGEVDFKLDLSAEQVLRRRETQPLVENLSKGNRCVRGSLTFEYSWRSRNLVKSNTLLAGTLELTVLNAERLISIDWKGSCMSDPFCVVIAHPHSPSEDGDIEEVSQRTMTVYDQRHPTWNETMTFEFLWNEEVGIENKVKQDMRTCSGLLEKDEHSSGQAAPVTHEKVVRLEEAHSEILKTDIPELQADVVALKKVVPQVQKDISDIRSDLALILEAVQKQCRFQQKVNTGTTDGASEVVERPVQVSSPADLAAGPQ
eukprot:gnl/TRDRNA2_/TRDRNA2_186395_c0_seq1.p1 gnl/TRDRNA2_/TRDRNA2_186395_c0~~gnl/TRDRNA2_/TRDRNA2_186395_c0_seq1.p1  ORF type:complete len:732 (-),score=128.69 gnl/TRDRNA2_/TRDRNA2_186395_c0_seq1:168-2363(-)